MNTLRECEQCRASEQKAMPWKDGKRKPLPAGRYTMLRGQSLAHTLLQTAVRNARWAGWLAATALHARLHERDELGRDWRIVVVYCPDRSDATTRRKRLLARHAKGRAVRQAQPATHAHRKFGVVQKELHDAYIVGESFKGQSIEGIMA